MFLDILRKILALFLILNWLHGSYAKPTVKPFIVSVIAEHFQLGIDIGVWEGILLGGRKKFALKITICPKNRQLALKLTF